jgi:hypothetical protein
LLSVVPAVILGVEFCGAGALISTGRAELFAIDRRWKRARRLGDGVVTGRTRAGTWASVFAGTESALGLFKEIEGRVECIGTVPYRHASWPRNDSRIGEFAPERIVAIAEGGLLSVRTSARGIERATVVPVDRRVEALCPVGQGTVAVLLETGDVELVRPEE